ncbi:hypothetical protein EK21DRAFT_86492 [Setomelanomma holmii]|uniref:Uncharacterized protein n=1 Tax=Setomelanomma holmii TaxID=210430 RepID=A0A9P4LR47_9PLEO|nr:hypothetical protein EK21DRAFT_86492 [Setomelanomma holmii]
MRTDHTYLYDCGHMHPTDGFHPLLSAANMDHIGSAGHIAAAEDNETRSLDDYAAYKCDDCEDIMIKHNHASGADSCDDEWRQSHLPSTLRDGGRRGRRHDMTPSPPLFTPPMSPRGLDSSTLSPDSCTPTQSIHSDGYWETCEREQKLMELEHEKERYKKALRKTKKEAKKLKRKLKESRQAYVEDDGEDDGEDDRSKMASSYDHHLLFDSDIPPPLDFDHDTYSLPRDYTYPPHHDSYSSGTSRMSRLYRHHSPEPPIVADSYSQSTVTLPREPRHPDCPCQSRPNYTDSHIRPSYGQTLASALPQHQRDMFGPSPIERRIYSDARNAMGQDFDLLSACGVAELEVLLARSEVNYASDRLEAAELRLCDMASAEREDEEWARGEDEKIYGGWKGKG